MNAIRRTVSVVLVLPFLALAGCAVTEIDGMDSGTGSAIGSGIGSGYGIGGKDTSIGKVAGVNALGNGDVDIDPYTLQPYGVNPFGYGVGLDAYGYPVADWYGGYGDMYPGYLVGPAGVVPSAASAVGVAASAGRDIRPHEGPASSLRSRLGPVTRVGALP